MGVRCCNTNDKKETECSSFNTIQCYPSSNTFAQAQAFALVKAKGYATFRNSKTTVAAAPVVITTPAEFGQPLRKLTLNLQYFIQSNVDLSTLGRLVKPCSRRNILSFQKQSVVLSENTTMTEN